MLMNRGYIPKYLQKRKIEIIRLKILKRKYGYLFYRRTISNILPSEAKKYYQSRLKWNTLRRWEIHWYKERKEWKLLLRAEIHYNLTLTNKFLQKWKFFILLRKSSRIKSQIASTHYSQNYSRQLLLHALSKWKWFLRCCLYEKMKKQMANTFFKSKYKPEILRTYLCRWMIYTKVSRKNTLKLSEALKYYETAMITKAFNKLKTYWEDKKYYKNFTNQAKQFFENNLKLKTFIKMKDCTKQSIHEKQNTTLAITHFCYKLKQNCFSKLKKNKNRNQSLKANLRKIASRQNTRIKKKYFDHFKIYHAQKMIKNGKIEQAVDNFEKNLKKIAIKNLFSYIQYRRAKKQKSRVMYEAIYDKIKMNKLRYMMMKWKNHTRHQLQEKCKMGNAEEFFKQYLQRKYFNFWKKFENHKLFKRMKLKNACVFHAHALLKTHLGFWKRMVQERKQFIRKLTEAKTFYQNKITKEGLLMIMQSGLNTKENILKISKEKMSYQLFLTHKYLSRWKQRTIYNKKAIFKSAATYSTENAEIIELPSDVGWYPICFLTPRFTKLIENV